MAAVLHAIEERNARVPFAALQLVAADLDCNPVELLVVAAQEESERGGGG